MGKYATHYTEEELKAIQEQWLLQPIEDTGKRSPKPFRERGQKTIPTKK